jgi:hypothetical protein
VKRNALPLAGCGMFVAVGLPMLVFGQGETRLIGAMSVLFFGCGGLALLLPLVNRRGGGAVRIVDVGAERGFLFGLGRAKRIVVIIAAAGMTAASALLIGFGYAIVGALGVITFGAFMLYAALTLGRPHGLALTPTRVVVRGASGGELPWDAVAGVGFVEHARARYIGIDATDRALLRRTGPRWLARVNRKLVPVDLLVPADHLAAAPEHALRALIAYLEDPQRRRAIGTEAELARLG